MYGKIMSMYVSEIKKRVLYVALTERTREMEVNTIRRRIDPVDPVYSQT